MGNAFPAEKSLKRRHGRPAIKFCECFLQQPLSGGCTVVVDDGAAGMARLVGNLDGRRRTLRRCCSRSRNRGAELAGALLIYGSPCLRPRAAPRRLPPTIWVRLRHGPLADRRLRRPDERDAITHAVSRLASTHVTGSCRRPPPLSGLWRRRFADSCWRGVLNVG